MTVGSWNFGTFNAKKMSSAEVAGSFVIPPQFALLTGGDHCYVIGPRGSGKTTLLRMLHGEALMAWSDASAPELRSAIGYTSIFLPADELWASQTTAANARAAFTAQMLYAFVETMIYRTGPRDSSGNQVHLPVTLSHDEVVALVQQCAQAWGLHPTNLSLYGLLEALDLRLVSLPTESVAQTEQIGIADPMLLLGFGIRAFNRAAKQPDHRWALLLDEMELAPSEIHNDVVNFVRGGSGSLILKISMSPFDRYAHSFGVQGGPIPGHDFQTIHLSGQSRGEIYRFTSGLWDESLAARGLPSVSISQALGASSIDMPGGNVRTTQDQVQRVLQAAQSTDPDFARWLRTRKIDVDRLDGLTYNEKSATVRKVYPLLVFRDAVMTFRNNKSVRRTRKKSLEPFTGSSAVTTALEGNPRWIKTAFAQMLDSFDERTMKVEQGVQFDALRALSTRFESLLRVLPKRSAYSSALPVSTMVDVIATYLSNQNTGPFTPDPRNCFVIDQDAPGEMLDTMVMGLYAGAFVHVRDGKSPAVLTDFRGQRFRLAYLLGIRDKREFPLRLGRDVRLSDILLEARSRGQLPQVNNSEQLGLDF